MRDSAAEFLSFPDEDETEFVGPGSSGNTRMFVVDVSEAVVAFLLHHAKRAAALLPHEPGLRC